MQQLAHLGYKSQTTAAAIGDLIESKRITLLFDQADNLKQAHVDLCTDSYRAGARRSITNMDKRGQPQEFDTFGPKAFAGTQPLPHDLADRPLLVTTSPSAKTLPPVEFDDERFAQIRADSYRWTLLDFWKLRGLPPFVDPHWHGLANLRGRQRELWLPIEVMMEALDVPEPDRAAACKYYERSQASTKAELPEDKAELLSVLLDVVGEREVAEVTRAELLKRLGVGGDEELDQAADFDKWTPQKLGMRLKSLGVFTKEPRRLDGNTNRLYALDGQAVRRKAERLQLTE